jgi:hypothetical protein
MGVFVLLDALVAGGHGFGARCEVLFAKC